MLRYYKDKNGCAEIWATSNVPAEEIDRLIMECRNKGLRPVIYRSGTRDLGELTAELLSVNRGLVLEKAPRREWGMEL